MTLPIRPPGPRRRGRSVTRASALLSRVRLLAAAVLFLTSAGFYGLGTSPIFALDRGRVEISGTHYTDETTVMAALGLDVAVVPNVFRIRTGAMEAAVAALPAVRAATIRAILPDRLEVAIDERVPILVWRHGDLALLADIDGRLFAPAAVTDLLPVIDDARPDSSADAVGTSVATVDFEVARILGAITTADLGTAATSIGVTLDDDDGWVLTTPGGWRAVFGHYTAELRPTTLIDGQVQCLAALLAQGEADVSTVTLALTDQTCGTYTPVSTPTPSPEPSRSRRP
ncbi:MAG: FtsQ-type POTRA domain-containing protein [Candidatus Limnocylindrales bacterium]